MNALRRMLSWVRGSTTRTRLIAIAAAAMLTFAGLVVIRDDLLVVGSDFSESNDGWRFGPDRGTGPADAIHRGTGGFDGGFLLGVADDRPPRSVDLAIVLDLTSSMGGSIDGARAAARELVVRFRDQGASLRLALVGFRDTDYDAEPVVASGFTSDVESQLAVLSSWNATGGGYSAEEDVYLGILRALEQDWRPDTNAVRALVLVTDNPAKQGDSGGNTAAAVGARAHRARVGIYPIIVGGNAAALQEAEVLAGLTGGTMLQGASAGDVGTRLVDAVSASVEAADPSYWHAPEAFLGNVSLAHRQPLAFSIRRARDAPSFSHSDDVVLVGRDRSLVYRLPEVPDTGWTHHRLFLDETFGWRVRDEGRRATTEDFEAVLSDLRALRIRGEYSIGQDSVGLDNVLLLGSREHAAPCEVEETGVRMTLLEPQQRRVPAGAWIASMGPGGRLGRLEWTGQASGHLGTIQPSGTKIFGTVNSDRILRGYWVRYDGRGACLTPRDGSHRWGRIAIRFDSAFSVFDARWSNCEDLLRAGREWTGVASDWRAPATFGQVLGLLHQAERLAATESEAARPLVSASAAWVASRYERRYDVPAYDDARQLEVMQVLVTQAMSRLSVLAETVGGLRPHMVRHAITAVEAAAEPLLVLNGELTPSESQLMADVDFAYDMGAVIVGSTVVVLVAAPFVVQGAILLGSEGLFLVATHPVEAVMAAEFAIGTAFAIVSAGGPEALVNTDAWADALTSPEAGMEMVMFLVVSRGQSVPRLRSSRTPPAPADVETGDVTYRRVSARVESVEGEQLHVRILDVDDVEDLPQIRGRCRGDVTPEDFLEVAEQIRQRSIAGRNGIAVGYNLSANRPRAGAYQQRVDEALKYPRRASDAPPASLRPLFDEAGPTAHHRLPARRSRSSPTEGILHSSEYEVGPILGSSRSDAPNLLEPGFENVLMAALPPARQRDKDFITMASTHVETQAVGVMRRLARLGYPVDRVYLDINHHAVCGHCLGLKPFLERLMPPNSRLIVRPINPDGTLGTPVEYSGDITPD